ncbi:MAG: hypothetical protein AB8U40_02930 [Anaplasma ovis]
MCTPDCIKTSIFTSYCSIIGRVSV